MSHPRRSFVLVAVLVIVASAVLVATSLLFVAQGRAADVASSADIAQARSLAWSGVQVVMANLSDQRSRLLRGELPQLDPQYVVYESGSRTGVIRLLPMTSDEQTLIAAEAGKLDLNAVDAQALANTGLIDLASANVILAYRAALPGRGFQSVAELLPIPNAGLNAERLYGPIDQIKTRDQAQLNRGDLAQRVENRLLPQRIRGVADVVTVFSCEPNVQRDGRARTNLNVTWSEALAAQVTDRFGQDATDRLKKFFDDGVKFDSVAKIVQALLDSRIPPKDWSDPLDFFTAYADADLFGRLDINTAPAEAIAGLPGITTEQASQMVSVRQELSRDDLSTIAWPVSSQIITGDQLTQIADKITTRCFQFRVRVAAGEIPADQLDGPMSNLMILEAVIDVSEPTPRVAYLRDISVLQAAAQIALESSANQPAQVAFEPDREIPSASEPETLEESSSEPAATSPGSPSEPINDSESDDPTQAKSANSEDHAAASSQRHKVGRWRSGL